ncbi:MAG: flavodoxin-dependent (E)-4-hydroxy-3-methylbut-2-enyl-diphosphate synthase [Firmicutes bacterium]|nr:flavodoxin-dependent (E)-4-hydroxy-3-methylbut-2-enyl-diphosphate synthase [Bacillota bacterium]
MYTRAETKIVQVGEVKIGGGNPVVVQSMANADPHDFAGLKRQVEELAAAGCEVVRLTVPDQEAADVFRRVKKVSPVPLVADIHFDYRMALAAIKAGADKIRINPGNIGSEERVSQVLAAAKAAGIPIRIGVNSGSLPKDLLDKYGVSARAMVEAAERIITLCAKHGFEDLVFSLKASSVPLAVEANLEFARRFPFPLHLGITEAGPAESGIIKSAAGLGGMLVQGIGDTIRVSLTGNPVQEVEVAYRILQAFGLREYGPTIVSCPTCGRCQVDLENITRAVSTALKDVKKSLKVAVMGCAVNGPGEAREADIGIACGPRGGLLFKNGEIVAKISEDQLIPRLISEIKEMSGRKS